MRMEHTYNDPRRRDTNQLPAKKGTRLQAISRRVENSDLFKHSEHTPEHSVRPDFNLRPPI